MNWFRWLRDWIKEHPGSMALVWALYVAMGLFTEQIYLTAWSAFCLGTHTWGYFDQLEKKLENKRLAKARTVQSNLLSSSKGQPLKTDE